MYKNTIKYWKDKKGVSSKHLAKKCDVSQQTFSSWINNHTQPDVIEGAILSEELGITLNDLVKKEEEKPTKEEFLKTPVEYLDFESRYFQLLKRNLIHTYKDLLDQDRIYDLKLIRGAGPKARGVLKPKIEELKAILEKDYK